MASIAKKFKLRWFNGEGFEDGKIFPYHYFVEVRETETLIELDTKEFEDFLRTEKATLNDFRRGSRQYELLEKVVKTFLGGRYQ